MSWKQIAGSAILVAGCVALYIWGPAEAQQAAAGLGGAAGAVLGGALTKRGA